MSELEAEEVDKDAFLEALSDKDEPGNEGDFDLGDASPDPDETAPEDCADDGLEHDETIERPSFEKIMDKPEDPYQDEQACIDEVMLKQLISGDAIVGNVECSSRGQAVRAPGGILATFRPSEIVQGSLMDQRSMKNMENLRRDYQINLQLAENARNGLEDEEVELRNLKRQAETGKLQDLGRLGYQEREVTKAWDRLTACEMARDLAELAVHKASVYGGIAEHACKMEQHDHYDLAGERHLKEVRRAQRNIDKENAQRAAVDSEREAHRQEILRNEKEARKHHAQGIKHLKKTQAELAKQQIEMDELREIRFNHNANRFLTLRASVQDSARKIQSQNETRNKQVNKVRKEREERRQQMKNDGQNPYEVWRREEIEADKEKQRRRIEQLGERRSEKLLENMMTEDSAYRRNKQIEKKKRKQADEFQKEVGNYAKQQKIAAYIRKVTIGNVDVLDPTGTALRIDPSKVTVQKTHAFGLGRASANEIEKVQSDTLRMSMFLVKRRSTMRPQSGSSDDDAGNRDDGAIGQGDNDADISQESKLWTPKLSKLEEQYLTEARERQKQNITSVQRCWGKEFKGDAFLARPSIISFDDFVVGQKYRQVIEVTNVSLTFNQFKLLPLDSRYQEFFEIEFQPPGRMSAGVTRYITLWFLPKVPEDITTTFPILAKTGRIDFPLRCTTKKTVLTITPQDADENPLINFGHVLSGETNTCVLKINNSGALPAEFELQALEPENDIVPMMIVKPQNGEFKPRGSTTISFTFAPTALGDYSTQFRLTVGNGALGDAGYKGEWVVHILGSCVDVPIYVENQLYDLKTCIYDHIFRQNVVIHNRRSVPMKIEVEKPRQIDGQLQINPALAYIQGYKAQAIQIKFSPKEDFLDKNPQYRDPERKDQQGAFQIPIVIVGAEQALPVRTVLVGTLSSNNLEFIPSAFNFGRCFVGSTVACRLAVVNHSLLPQRYIFPRLPSFLSVVRVPTDVVDEEENDSSGIMSVVLEGGDDGAMGMLLPGERRDLCVAYTPDTATELNLQMELKAIAGNLCAREFGIECRGQGVPPLITTSHNKIQLASIPSGAVSKESVVIQNSSKTACTVNLVLPPREIAALKASPVCVTLEPGDCQRVQIEFCPNDQYVNLMRRPDEEETPPAEGEVPAGDQEEGKNEPEETLDQLRHRMKSEIRKHGGRRWENETSRTIHASWKIAAFMRIPCKTGLKKEKTKEQEKDQIIYLGVDTCVLPPILTASPTVLNFGEVTAQQRRILPLTFQAEGDVDPQRMILEALPESSCFTVLSAPRTVGSKPFQLMVEFNPQLVQVYQTVLQVRTQSTQFQVPLRGRGVRPVLKIEPEDGILKLGAVTYGKEGKDHTKEDLVVKNDSPFELCYSLEAVAPADPNHTGPPPFVLTPSTGVVEANSSKTVTVTFRPHRPLAVFQEKILVNVPNQKEPTFVHLYGHCFKYQNYALSGVDFLPFTRRQAERPPAFVDSISFGVGSGANCETGDFEFPQAQKTDFLLQFEEGQRTQHLLVGSCVPPGYPAASQNTPAPAFDFQIVQSEYSKYFTVEAPEGSKPDKGAKGPLQPGKLPIKAVFRYTPEETTSLKIGDVNLDLLGGIGQWITCQVKGILTGGYAPPGAPATQELNIELRAYLQQI